MKPLHCIHKIADKSKAYIDLIMDQPKYQQMMHKLLLFKQFHQN